MESILDLGQVRSLELGNSLTSLQAISFELRRCLETRIPLDLGYAFQGPSEAQENQLSEQTTMSTHSRDELATGASLDFDALPETKTAFRFFVTAPVAVALGRSKPACPCWGLAT